MSNQTISPVRRSSSRIEPADGVWAIWRCNDWEVTSVVRNVSPGGVFVDTASPRAIGAKAEVYFLVPDGQISAEAVVTHVQAGRGLGLKFTAIREADRERMVRFIRRLRSLSR